MRYYERERREFVRVRAEVPVRFRLMGHDPSSEPTAFFDGATRDLSGGGMLLSAVITNPDFVPALLAERLFVAVEFDIDGEPVKALARTAWVQGPGEDGRGLFGLRFKEITRADLDRIFSFVISKSLT